MHGDPYAARAGTAILRAFGEEGVPVAEEVTAVYAEKCRKCKGERSGISGDLDPALNVPPGRRGH